MVCAKGVGMTTRAREFNFWRAGATCVRMASSSDSEEDVGLSNRKRAVRVRTRVLEDDPGNPRTDLFGDRELYAAEGESGDSESSLDKIKSSFAAEGECDPKRGGLKVSRKKDIRKMRIETQRILRGSIQVMCVCVCRFAWCRHNVCSSFQHPR